MWMPTPDDVDTLMVNLNDFHHIRIEQLDENEYVILGFVCADECCGFAVLKKHQSKEYLNSIMLGLLSCLDKRTKKFANYITMSPTLQ